MKKMLPFLCGKCRSGFETAEAVQDHYDSKHPKESRLVIYKKIMIYDRFEIFPKLGNPDV